MKTVLSFIALAAALAACATTAPPDATPAATTATTSSSSTSCDALAGSARDEVAAAIASHAACTSDADCVETSLGASCFDSCSRGVAANGLADVAAAKSRVNAAACAEFTARGCKVTVPPCAPPRAPRCVAGACAT